MKDQDKTKDQLIVELGEMRRKIVELEKSEIKHKLTEKKLRETEGKYLSIMDNIHDVIFQLSPLGIIKYVTPKVKELYGYKPEKLIGKHLKTTTPISEVPRALDALKILNSGKTIKNFEIKQLDSKGKIIYMEINATPVKNNGKIVALQGLMRNITERRKAEEELEKYKKNLEEMIEIRTNELKMVNERLWQEIIRRKKEKKVETALYKISEATNFTRNIDELFLSIHKIVAELMPAENFYIALYDDDLETLCFPYFIDEDEENPGPQKLGKGLTEYILRTGKPLLASPEVFEELEKRGEVVSVGPPSVDWLGVPLKTKDKTIGVLAIQSYKEDIRYTKEDKNILTFVSEQVGMAIDRKQAEEKIKTSLEEKEVMLREIHHRVKNNMQVVLSLIRLQTRNYKDESIIKMFKITQNRIKSMALIHESLYRSKDLASIDVSEYTKIMTTHLLAMYRDVINNRNLKVNIEDVYLDINRAIPCGLIISELVSNSLNHAFPKGRKGEIIVEMHSDKKGKHTLIIRDTGVGFPENLDIHETETLGMQLVTDLVKQLEGTIKLDREGGTTFKITF